MPVYEYRCEKCGDFEQTQRISDPPLARCPTCRRKVRRLISSTSFQLKGSGWYVTDYARGGAKANGGADTAKGATSESKSGTKTEAKTEMKADTKTETKPAASGTGDKSAS